jgi:hypothetical protein
MPVSAMMIPKLVTWTAVAMAAGCAGDDGSRPPSVADAVEVSTVDGPVLRHRPPFSDEGLAAEIRGMLELDGGCLYVTLADIGERYPLVWPAETSWDAVAQSVVLVDGTVLDMGTQVLGGGGFFDVVTVDRLLGSEAASVVERCLDNRYGEIAFVNNAPDAIVADVIGADV